MLSLEFKLFLGIMFHFIGDYITQNHWMASNKTSKSLPALIHATAYSLPFLLICNFWLWVIVLSSHFLIDRFRLAVYWIKLVNWNFKSKNFGYDDNVPAFLSVWLMIIVDNTFHILINSLCIYLSN